MAKRGGTAAVNPAAAAGGVLALDLATRTGWAHAGPESVPDWPRSKPFSGSVLVPPEPRPAVLFGTVVTGKPGTSHGHRHAALGSWLEEIAGRLRFSLVVIEQPMPAKFSRNLAATEIALGFRAVVQAFAFRRDLAFAEVPIVSAKAWFGSRMSKDKRPMIATAQSLGWQVGTDHEADALAILDLTLARAAQARRLAA